MPDNISTGSDGRIWVAMVSPMSAVVERLAQSPPVLRRVLWRLPDALQPKIKPQVWVLAFDADTGAAIGGVQGRRPDFGAVTGVVATGDRLWMSSIAFPALAHCPLPG